MTTQETNETHFLRIINKEMMENNLDLACYEEAQRRSSRGSNATMKAYVELRLKALKAASSDLPVTKREQSPIMTTQQCYKRVSSRTKNRYDKNSQETKQKLETVELWISRMVLFLGSIRAGFCLWSFTGESFSKMPLIPLFIIVAVIQVIPWIVKQSKLCSQLNATCALCILMACISCGGGVKLLKSNPGKKAPVEVQAKELENTITIVPAAGVTAVTQNAVTLNHN